MASTSQKSWGFFAFISIVVLLAAASFWLAPVAIGPLKVESQTVFSLLAMVFVVTLFMERAQEVILTNWRARGSEELELEILGLERQISRLKKYPDPDIPLEPLYTKIEQRSMARLHYRAHTRVLALRIGLVMGVAVSMAGLRTLGVFIEPHTLMAFDLTQQIIFHCVDVLITGGVIAGGSDGVHKMAELYRVFVETKAKEEKKKLSPLND